MKDNKEKAYNMLAFYVHEERKKKNWSRTKFTKEIFISKATKEKKSLRNDS